MPNGSVTLDEFCNRVHALATEYRRERGVAPTSISVTQDTYIQLCAAAGMVVKTIHGMNIIVH